MKENAGRIIRLCESWWDKLDALTQTEQQRYAEEFLRLLGWDLLLPFSPGAAADSMSARTYVLRPNPQTALATYFVMPGTLEPPSGVVDQGLDFCHATRELADEARGMNVAYAFITDLHRSYLYDLRTDELLLRADEPREFDAEFSEPLRRGNAERGALDDLRREPRSVSARRLREWCERWIAALSERARISQDMASIAVDRLMAVRHLFGHDILRRTKWRLEHRFMAITGKACSGRARGVGRDLTNLFHDMWFDWRIDLFSPCPELDGALQDDDLTASLLSEFALLSHSKFSLATVLESFNHGDPQEKMRVRMVPDGNEERESYLARRTVATIDQARIEVDVTEEGYRAIFYWFDKVVGLYDRLAVDFDRKASRTTPLAQDMDLFAWSEIDSNRPGACGDKIAYACENGIRLYYKGPRQLRICRLLLTLHLIGRYAQQHAPVSVFPNVAAALQERPAILPAERLLQPDGSLRVSDGFERPWDI